MVLWFMLSKFENEEDRQSKYIRNNAALSPNYWCREKELSITYSECVSVA